MKIELPEELRSVVEDYATHYKLPISEATRRLLDEVSAALEEGRGPSFLSLTWTKILKRRGWVAAPESTIEPGSKIRLGIGSKERKAEPEEESPSVFAPLSALSNIGELTPDQLSVLEKNPRTRSGFAGVYVHGRGFRGVVPSANGATKPLSTHERPELAAWERYRYYEDNKMPYGELGKSIAWLRSRYPGRSEEAIRRDAEELESLRAGPLPPGMSEE